MLILCYSVIQYAIFHDDVVVVQYHLSLRRVITYIIMLLAHE